MILREWSFRIGQRQRGALTARVVPLEDGYRIEAGRFSHALRQVGGDWVAPRTADSAAFALAALSMSHGVRITLDAPVSPSAAAQIAAIGEVYRLWAIPRLAPLRLELPHIADADPPRASGGGILCLSGGIDSTYAAIRARERGEASAGLLIAGADYQDAAAPGFVELKERVGAIARRLDLPLVTVETGIRRPVIAWDMLHGFALASALHALAGRFGAGGFAQDYARFQEVLQHPWGNNSVLPGLFSTPAFPVRGYGEEARRVEKLAAIAAHDPGLLPHLSVCWKDRSSGANCGRCSKCTTTRLAFLALGLSDRETFRETPPLAAAVAAMKPARGIVALRGQYVRISELAGAMPEGPIRDGLRAFEERLRRLYIRKMPGF